MRISDWSSDVCSSDLVEPEAWPRGLRFREPCLTQEILKFGKGREIAVLQAGLHASDKRTDRKSVVSGKSVSVRVDLGGRRIIKKKPQRLLYYAEKIIIATNFTV